MTFSYAFHKMQIQVCLSKRVGTKRKKNTWHMRNTDSLYVLLLSFLSLVFSPYRNDKFWSSYKDFVYWNDKIGKGDMWNTTRYPQYQCTYRRHVSMKYCCLHNINPYQLWLFIGLNVPTKSIFISKQHTWYFNPINKNTWVRKQTKYRLISAVSIWSAKRA